MRIEFMQRIDYWVGIVLTAALSAVELLRQVLLPRANQPPRRILFVELSEMGSAILAHSSMVKAEDTFPQAELFFLIFDRNRASVDLLGVIPPEQILVIRDDNFFAFSVSALQALRKIRRLQIDTTIDLELFSRFTALFCYLTGARMRVGFDNYTDEGLYRGNLITHRVYYNNLKHMSVNFLALVAALSEDPTEGPLVKRQLEASVIALPDFVASAEELAAARALLTVTLESPRFVVLNPDPGLLALRGWPYEYYRSLVEKLLATEPSAVVVVVGVRNSLTALGPLLNSISGDRVLNLVGKTATLRDLLAVFSLCDVLVTADSGPAHLASLTSLRSIVLFGPESSVRYKPLGPKAVALSADLACSPCFSAANHRRSACRDNQCMQQLSVERVFQATREALQPNAGASQH